MYLIPQKDHKTPKKIRDIVQAGHDASSCFMTFRLEKAPRKKLFKPSPRKSYGTTGGVSQPVVSSDASIHTEVNHSSTNGHQDSSTSLLVDTDLVCSLTKFLKAPTLKIGKKEKFVLEQVLLSWKEQVKAQSQQESVTNNTVSTPTTDTVDDEDEEEAAAERIILSMLRTGA